MDNDRSEAWEVSEGALRGTPEVRSIWMLSLGEIFFGARGIPKMSHLWLPLALLFDSTTQPKTAMDRSLFLILAVLCKVQFSILINDLSDRRFDSAVGKERWIGRLPGPVGYAIVFSFLAAGLVAVFLGGGSLPTTVAYMASVFFGLFYSLRPLRFKERGIAGLVVYSLSSVMIYVVVPWTWFDAGLWPLIFLSAAVGSDKWIQIHFHQVIDYRADVKNGTRTYALQAGLDRARSSLRQAARFSSLCMLSLIGFIVVFAGRALMQAIVLLALAAAVAVSKIYTDRTKNHPSPRSSALVRELPWIYLGLSFLVFYVLPPVLFFFSAQQERRLWILAVLSFLFLVGMSRQSLRYQYR